MVAGRRVGVNECVRHIQVGNDPLFDPSTKRCWTQAREIFALLLYLERGLRVDGLVAGLVAAIALLMARHGTV